MTPNFIPAILAALTPFVLGFVAAYLTYKDEPVEAQDTETKSMGKLPLSQLRSPAKSFRLKKFRTRHSQKVFSAMVLQ